VIIVNAIAGHCESCKVRYAFFYRPYSGERLCRKCFVESVETKVRATIAKYRMFNFNDKIAVAVSGGKDSLSLLHILAKMERHRPKATLVAVTVDEGIKGYRDEALKLATENCEKLKIPQHVVSFKELYGITLDEVVTQSRLKSRCELTSCAYCGVLRRRALNAAAHSVGANKIATGHTLDDEVQTALMNIFRGDISRLVKEKPVTDKVHQRLVQKVKPFCEIPEKESALYAYVKQIRFQDTPCPYASEALRNDIRLMLNQMENKHAGTKFTIAKSMERIRPALSDIEKKEGFRECVECGEPASAEFCKVCEMLRNLT
jgi:uncharacterized protein (TIGR00269 family)